MTKKFVIEKWIPALRSGKYKQGRWALRKNDCFCVLGVACDLLDPTWVEYTDEPGIYEWSNTRFTGAFPPERIGKSLPDDLLRNLVAFNDAGTSFEKLADILEERIHDS